MLAHVKRPYRFISCMCCAALKCRSAAFVGYLPGLSTRFWSGPQISRSNALPQHIHQIDLNGSFDTSTVDTDMRIFNEYRLMFCKDDVFCFYSVGTRNPFKLWLFKNIWELKDEGNRAHIVDMPKRN